MINNENYLIYGFVFIINLFILHTINKLVLYYVLKHIFLFYY